MTQEEALLALNEHEGEQVRVEIVELFAAADSDEGERAPRRMGFHGPLRRVRDALSIAAELADYDMPSTTYLVGGVFFDVTELSDAQGVAPQGLSFKVNDHAELRVTWESTEAAAS